MKLDKIKFARLIAMLASEYGYIHDDFIQAVDNLIDVEVPEQAPELVYPKNESVEALMALMVGGTRKLDAIRYHRAITGMGLKDSKEAVERHWPDGSKKLFSVADLRSKLNAETWNATSYAVIEAFIASL